MALRKELLKSIWYAFTALDVEKSGKVSKSQLKVRGIAGARGRLTHHTAPAPESQPRKPLRLADTLPPSSPALGGAERWLTRTAKGSA